MIQILNHQAVLGQNEENYKVTRSKSDEIWDEILMKKLKQPKSDLYLKHQIQRAC